MKMSRTRIVFAVIILVTLCAIGGVVLVQLITNRTDTGGQVEEGGQPTAVPEGTVLVTLASSNTKQNWLNQVVANFNAAGKTTASGAAIVVEVSHVTSGGSLTAILDGSSQPVAWSPGDSSWVDQANEAWRQRTNKPIASEACQPTIYAPLGFAMWRPMAEQLGWPDTPIGWDTIVALASDPEGWVVTAVPNGASSALGTRTRPTPIPACSP